MDWTKTPALLPSNHFTLDGRARVSPGRAVVPYQPNPSTVLRAAAEQRRRDHTPDLARQCRIDGHPHPCYDYTAAGLVLATVGGPGSTTPSSSTAVRVLVAASVVIAAGILAAVWLWWAR
jgi:hypothetical protein